MGDVYREIMVKRPQSAGDTIKKILLIAVVVVTAALAVLTMNVLLLGLAVALGFVASYLISSLKVEYEYLYVNGDIDVDKIMNKQRRKRYLSLPLSELVMLARSGSHELDTYRSGGSVRSIDLTSGTGDALICEAVYQTEKETRIVALELEPALIQDIRRRAPRKVAQELLLLGG